MIGPRSGPMQQQAVSALGPPPGVRVWLACGRTDMRKGLDGLAMLAQQVLNDNPFDGALFAFRGRRGGLARLLWYDGQGLCLFAKRLDRGHFVWPVTETGLVVTFVPKVPFWKSHDFKVLRHALRDKALI